MPLSSPGGLPALIDQDLIPDQDLTFDIGTETLRWKEIFSGANRAVIGDPANVNIIDPPPNGSEANIIANIRQYPGSIAELNIDSNNLSGFQPLLTLADIETYDAGGVARVNATGARGGILVGAAYAGYGTAIVDCNAGAATTLAKSNAFYANANSLCENNVSGSFLLGYAFSYYGGDAQLRTENTAFGSFLAGSCGCGYTGAYSEMLSNDRGQFVQGSVSAYNVNALPNGLFGSNANGGFVQGEAFADYGTYRAFITLGNNAASFAQGGARAINGGSVDAFIQSTGAGSFAQGRAYDGQIISTFHGSFAQGNATQGYNITASGRGSMARGYTSTGNIQATAANAVQFGPGVNALADSVQFGNAGIRIKGTAGAPGALQDGDIWRAGAYVYIRSNGVSVQI